MFSIWIPVPRVMKTPIYCNRLHGWFRWPKSFSLFLNECQICKKNNSIKISFLYILCVRVVLHIIGFTLFLICFKDLGVLIGIKVKFLKKKYCKSIISLFFNYLLIKVMLISSVLWQFWLILKALKQ